MAATEMMNSVQVVSARSQARRALGLLGGRATLGPFAALLLAIAFFSFESNLFLRGPNLSLILQQSVEVGTPRQQAILAALAGRFAVAPGI